MSPDETQLNAVHLSFWPKCVVHIHKTNNKGMHETNNRDIYETNEIASGFLLQLNMSNPPFIVPKTPQFTKVHNCFCIVSSCFKSSLHCSKGDRSKIEWFDSWLAIKMNRYYLVFKAYHQVMIPYHEFFDPSHLVIYLYHSISESYHLPMKPYHLIFKPYCQVPNLYHSCF